MTCGTCTPSALLNADDLKGIESTVADTFDRTCTVLRESRAPDGMGGQNVSWTEVAPNIACRIVSTDLRFAATTDRVATIAVTKLTVPRSTDVEMGDKVVLDDASSWRVETVPLLQPSTKTLRVAVWRT